MKQLPLAPNEFDSDTTDDYYTDIFNNKKNNFQLFNVFGDDFSTNLCLTHPTDFVLTGMDKEMHSGMISIDL